MPETWEIPMVKPKVRVAGFLTTDSYLSVHFTVGVGTSVRYLEAKVPMSDLAKDVQFGTAYDRVCGRLLRDHWEVDTALDFTGAPAAVEPAPWDECAEDCRGCDGPLHDD